MAGGGKKLPILGVVAADPASLLQAGDSAAAIDALQAQLRADPDDAVGWLQLGAAYVSIEHWAQAAQALASAVEIDGSSLAGRRLFARALGQLNRPDEAVFQLLQAKRLAPENAQVVRELGVAFYDKRLFDKALRELVRALELDPDDARAHFAAGLAQEAKSDMAAAIASYRRAVACDPAFVDARRTLADALAAMGEMAAAVEQLEQALQHDRTNTQVALNLEVLQRGLAELRARRLLGQSEAEIDRSALVQEGQLKRRGRVHGDDGQPLQLRYTNELAEMWVTLDAAARVQRLMLVLPDPQRAAAQVDDVFRVTIVSEDGRETPANYATAISLTFLREALGCPMTRASAIYGELLRSQQVQSWAGASVGFDALDRGDESLPGLYVDARLPSS